MLTSDFNFHLPAASIAQHAAARGTSRLLVLNARGADRNRAVADLPEILRPGDLLVVNDTRVIPARLFARRASTQSQVELLLVERHGLTEWDALAKPGKRARVGERLLLGGAGEKAVLQVEVLAKAADGRHRVRFSEPIEPHLEELGHVPLPPYIKRSDDEADRERYQTVFSRFDGAIAAPTAGLHFTPEILDAARTRGIEICTITLHVGIGTFKPVTAELVHEHPMESERFEISADTATAIARTRALGGRIVAVGTTVVRTLEAAALATGEISPASGRTDIFITPGFRFRAVNVLLTNFHLPRSTLLMLVSAFAGRERVLAAYNEAIRAGYRFYSYGDAMLVDRA
ncbi:MAG: tRNA preQ1(34) S-adenosylmethionine ribosyltransferase-isomerase QueA [Acidobacteriota bacterium]